MLSTIGFKSPELAISLDKDLYFAPEGATNDEVFNILDFSFDYLIENKDILVSKFGGKGFGLLLAKTLQNNACFKENSFSITNFHLIPTDFYNFSGESIVFSGKQKMYLKKVFDSFSNVSNIAIRSSADIEDAGDKNYSGVFYSGFCSTTNFDQFLEETKKVLESTGNVKDLDAKMGVVIMEVPGQEYENGNFCPEGGGVMATTNFGDRTTISSEFGLPVGITSGKENDVITLDFNENGKVIQACVREGYTFNFNIGGKYVLNKGILKKYCSNTCLVKIGSDGVLGNFNQDIYKNLVYIGKQLEKIFGYPLDIEFAVNNGQIYILQIRKYPNNYPRPDNMQFPNLESKEVVLNISHIFSGLGYLNNVSLYFEVLQLPFISSLSTQESRNHDNQVLLEALDELEKKYNGEGYAIYLRRLETFPSIDLKRYPGLKLITFKSDIERYRLSHTYMILRESRVPHIVLRDNPDPLRAIRRIKKATVYLDGNNGLFIYTDSLYTYK